MAASKRGIVSKEGQNYFFEYPEYGGVGYSSDNIGKEKKSCIRLPLLAMELGELDKLIGEFTMANICTGYAWWPAGNTQLEIERKWILKRVPFLDSTRVLDEYSILQFYSGDFRYRRETHRNDINYMKTKKVAIKEGVFMEEEFPTNYEEFHKEIAALGLYSVVPVIAKKRLKYRLEDSNLILDLDNYTNLILVMAELELPSIHYDFTLPKEVEAEIIMEVTGLQQFSNRKLARL